ncbi:hypothetical protein CpB1048 [Chlamydia pneumoniae TW-183]|uniref:UPF0056 inner membrane protein n=1 Tax=Chlamydia pneumoniae TaxID=83558 RepID=A0A0F7WN66_CHLPN|nr:MarC family protein [Chlamydia pneumoniae]AAD19147.1 CT852 hypothetical protein [Chlamydia pneumoniae CWL029]AAP98977.1 hypothetical protein CpB1048 [Chlamydia pneumoniae TW-183]CRI33552.1 UPF0056 membrane protein CPn_1010/CP_0843/CPj1010/CpB1048 [Chlamydia pneumoniae]CRI37541.1 UPF0056 membrane protein CPn_1010/CP_0843/CPj1010/CpB1048 [Chlamydia pneumoniae]CRI38673.1 UPF0056 membrane protein CPn_1010/CP_0843/CPj1010/CpB1048 [Chlamydia pneumoniae]
MLILLNLSLLFYVLFDSPGSIPVFVALLKNFSRKKQQRVILRECLFALGALILFVTFGRSFFQFLDISLYAFQIIGGFLLFTVSIKMMLAPMPEKAKDDTSKTEPIFFPLAFPVITGPAVITALLSYMEEGIYSREIIFTAMIIAWAFSLFTLLCSSFFDRLFGNFGLLALERLFGIALLLMSVNLMLKGISIAFNIGFYIG